MRFAIVVLCVAALAFAASADELGTLVTIDSPLAACLDGSPVTYYFRPGSGDGVSKWLIYTQGGGWCSSIEDCYARSQTTLGSSKTYTPTMDFGGGYFSQNVSENPMMYNWNVVWIPYCDGGSYSGLNLTTTTYNDTELYFRGHYNLMGIIEDVVAQMGVPTDVVYTGCSAGGLAVYLHLDEVAAYIRANAPTDVNINIVGLPDSGFFMDYESAANYHGLMVWVYQQHNSSYGINQRCVSALGQNAWQCIFAQYTSPYITTPIFPLQSEYDSWQAGYDLDSTDPVMINLYGTNLTTWVKNSLLTNAQNGVFLDSCFHHCGEWGSIVINGMNQAQAFEAWYNGQASIFIQAQVYPCSACCQADAPLDNPFRMYDL